MTPFRQLPLWEEPAAGTVVRDGAGRRVTHPDGRTTTKTGRSYTWLLCDQCGCGTWVGRLAPKEDRLEDEEYRKGFPRCRLTPHCPGRHVVARESS